MKLGIFAKTFSRPTFEDVLDAIIEHGITQVQFNLVCAGVPTLPDSIDHELIARVRSAFEARMLDMAALSGTFNMIHPDHAERQRGLKRLAVLAPAAREMGAPMITLCTGTRDPKNMWAAHPENRTESAWSDLLRSMETALKIAEQSDVSLGIEPEVTNVVSSAQKARALLDAFRSPRLKIVMDPANLFAKGGLARMHEILDEAFDLLGPDIALAHAKDISKDGDAGHEAAGTGMLDYDAYIANLRRIEFNGALILHSLTEAQVPDAVRFVRQKMSTVRGATAPTG
jgi:sugar phosphate isomerase/epimerase